MTLALHSILAQTSATSTHNLDDCAPNKHIQLLNEDQVNTAIRQGQREGNKPRKYVSYLHTVTLELGEPSLNCATEL